MCLVFNPLLNSSICVKILFELLSMLPTFAQYSQNISLYATLVWMDVYICYIPSNGSQYVPIDNP